MVIKCKIDLPRYSVLTPFPNTDLYKKLESENRIKEDNWALYDVEHCVFEPKNMTRAELEQGLAWAWKETYKIRNIIRRIDWFKPRIFRSIAILTNIGYRKYAKHFKIFDEQVMTDNSDIPNV